MCIRDSFWTSPRGIATAVCMPLVGYLLGRGWDGRRMLAFGFGIAGLSFFGFAHMTLQSGTWDIFWIQILQGAAMGLLFVPLTTLTMASIPTQETGYATSLDVYKRQGCPIFATASSSLRWGGRTQTHQLSG